MQTIFFLNFRVNDKNIGYLDDYSQLLATVMTDEEHRLLMVENKWKKSRKQTKLQDSRKKPLDIVKYVLNTKVDNKYLIPKVVHP